jgi:hypothetical protein
MNIHKGQKRKLWNINRTITVKQHTKLSRRQESGGSPRRSYEPTRRKEEPWKLKDIGYGLSNMMRYRNREANVREYARNVR